MGSDNNIFEILEKRLDHALMPVTPEEHYIEQLNTRLFAQPRVTIEKDNLLKLIALISLSFATGLVLVVLLNRIFSSGGHKETA